MQIRFTYSTNYVRCIAEDMFNFFSFTIRFPLDIYLNRQSCYRGQLPTYLQAELDSKEMKQIMAWFGTLEQHTAGGNKGGGSNSALEPAGPTARLQPISLTALFPTELFLLKELCQEECHLSSNHLSLGFTRLSPVYNRNIIMPTTTIDLLTVHFHWSSQMVSLGKALAKTDMMTPIRLHWYSNTLWIYVAWAAVSSLFGLRWSSVIYPVVTLSQKSLNVMLINYSSLPKRTN